MSEGAYSLSYYNEPLSYRVAQVPSLPPGTPEQTDLINVFRSMPRIDPVLNSQPVKGTPIDPAQAAGFKYPPAQEGAEATDPYTPLLRAYEGDNVQIRNLVGAHMAPHSFHIHGLNWQFEPSLDSSGFRSTQGMGISEHYELLFHLPVTSQPKSADYLYIPTSDPNGLQYGNWGLIRGYKEKQRNLIALSETQAKAFPGGQPIPPAGAPVDTCAPGAPLRHYDVTAVFAPSALPEHTLVYNSRGAAANPGQTYTDPNALMYVLTDDLVNGELPATVPREPLILRAAAGECITVTLNNGLPGTRTKLNRGIGAVPQPALDAVTLQTSHCVGLHPQLLAYDVTTSDGFNIGSNAVTETASPGGTVDYKWYAGRVTRDGNGKAIYTPVEFGAVNLAPADALMQDNFGLIGALIIEPQGSKWTVNEKFSRAQATVTKADGTFLFREGVAIVQDDLAAVGVPALNYRTEPFSYRYVNQDFLANDPSTITILGISRSQSDTLVSADPQTPVFAAEAGKALRLRVLHPAGLNEEVFELHGHAWQEEPYSKGSLQIVDYNPFSQWTGSRDTFGANAAFDVVLKHAGGSNAVKGDYLFRTFIGKDFQNGMWGLLRVGEPGKDVVTVTSYCKNPTTGTVTVAGVNTVNPSDNVMAATVTISGEGLAGKSVDVNPRTGRWSTTVPTEPPAITVTSAEGGMETAKAQCPIQAVPATTPKTRNSNDLDRFTLKPATIANPNPKPQ